MDEFRTVRVIRSLDCLTQTEFIFVAISLDHFQSRKIKSERKFYCIENFVTSESDDGRFTVFACNEQNIMIFFFVFVISPEESEIWKKFPFLNSTKFYLRKTTFIPGTW